MPAEHPGVVQFKFISRTIDIPAVAAIELSDLQQPIVNVIHWRRKSKMMTYSLGHGSEQNPVVCVCAFIIYLSKPGHDLFLLCLVHLVEDTLAAHPYGHSNIGTFYDALI